MTATALVYDAIRVNAASLPPGHAAGYATGTGIVPWGAAEWAAHPGAVRIDQDAAASDHTADVLDVESGAATIADCAPWAKAALASYRAGTRPGQRSPAVYMSESAVTPVVNALIAGGVTGVGLWVANWNLDQAGAESAVTAGRGPFPVIGVQFRDAGSYDVSVFSTAWLDAISGKPGTVPAGRTNVVVTRLPPGDWKPGGPLILIGPGPDGTSLWQTISHDGITWSPPVKL